MTWYLENDHIPSGTFKCFSIFDMSQYMHKGSSHQNNSLEQQKVIHNIKTLCFESVTSPVTSKITTSHKQWPSRLNFWLKLYIGGERVYT